MKLRTTTPWMPAPDYGKSLQGLGVNLLVRDIERALRLQRAVLGAAVVYSDHDFAVIRGPAYATQGGEWMLHADHTYDRHPLYPLAQNAPQRGCRCRTARARLRPRSGGSQCAPPGISSARPSRRKAPRTA